MFHLTPIQTLLMIRRNGKATSRLYFCVNQFCLGRASWKPIVLKFRSPLRYSTSYFPEFLKTLSKKRFVSYNVTSEGNYFKLIISVNQRCVWSFQTRISLATQSLQSFISKKIRSYLFKKYETIDYVYISLQIMPIIKTELFVIKPNI